MAIGPNWGFWKVYHRLRLDGHPWNHKRVYRIYTAMGLNLRRSWRRRPPSRTKEPLLQPLEPNMTWSMDFMSDALANGRPFRTFNLIDDYNREILNITIDRSITSARVVSELTREWILTYNQLRPHDSIGRQTPVGFLRKRMGHDHFPTLMTDQPKHLHSLINRVAV